MEYINGGAQIDINDILPDGFELAVRRFTDTEYAHRQSESALPRIKSAHEAYGVLAECYVALKRSTNDVKSAVDGALSALPAGCTSVSDQVDRAYSGCLDAAVAAVNMAINAQNVAHALAFAAMGTDTPLERMAQAAPEPEDDEAIEVPEDEVAL